MKPKLRIRHNSEFVGKVWAATKKIPRGKVATYTAIAAMAGNPRAARATGNALNQNRDPFVPCHRVVRSDGSVGGFVRGIKIKIEFLRREGVVIKNGIVDQKFIL